MSDEDFDVMVFLRYAQDYELFNLGHNFWNLALLCTSILIN